MRRCWPRTIAVLTVVVLGLAGCGNGDDDADADADSDAGQQPVPATTAPSPTAAATTPPPVQTTPPATGGETVYEVQEGDTLWAIAEEFGTTVDAIAEANGIDDPSSIFPGDELVIPPG